MLCLINAYDIMKDNFLLCKICYSTDISKFVIKFSFWLNTFGSLDFFFFLLQVQNSNFILTGPRINFNIIKALKWDFFVGVYFQKISQQTCFYVIFYIVGKKFRIITAILNITVFGKINVCF